MQQPHESWTVADATEFYDVDRWGGGYFSINAEGQLCVHPTRDPDRSIDLKQLVDRLRTRDIDPPILFRFGEIIQSRLLEINSAFTSAISEYGYEGRYCCVFPIKVNQQRQVVEEVLRHGGPLGGGLEAGSKPELLAVMALAEDQTPIICNGFKDAEYIETAMLARKMGRNIVPVIEKYSELANLLKIAERIGVRPTIGMRVKLATRGAGRWQSSGGYRSKFGLTVSEILSALKELKEREMGDCFKLLHFHLGSQITNIRIVKNALTEAARIFVELHRLGANLQYIDVGGGLGVDYDGSQTNFESSMNYTLQEYANDVVYHVQTACNDAGVPHPTIVSESGRAVVAHHSLLVFNVLGTSGRSPTPEMTLPEEAQQPLVDLRYALQELTSRNVLEIYHDAQQALDTTLNLFSAGYMTLDQRALAERLYWAICRKIQQSLKDAEETPEELEHLDVMLSDTYFCNFSLFQSMPDSWAIKQLFPVMPIHRLEQKPTQSAVLGDITCDSDGKIERFIDRRDVKRTITLHELDQQSPYLIGAFLVGAYQEILGDLHNLFGDTNAVHVRLGEGDEVVLESVDRGDRVRDVLAYVNFSADELERSLRGEIERAVRENRLNDDEAGRLMRFYHNGIEGYTYLEDAGEE